VRLVAQLFDAQLVEQLQDGMLLRRVDDGIRRVRRRNDGEWIGARRNTKVAVIAVVLLEPFADWMLHRRRISTLSEDRSSVLVADCISGLCLLALPSALHLDRALYLSLRFSTHEAF